MFDFIVLGLVPGTHIQIAFLPWVLMVLGVGCFIALRRSYRSRRVRAWFIALMLFRTVQHSAVEL